MSLRRLTAGVAETEITPPVEPSLVGELAPRVASGVRTPLLAKALALSDGDCTLALVTLDLVGLRREDADRLAGLIAEQTGLDPDAVMLLCSHTRAGAATVALVGGADVDEGYVASLGPRIAGVVGEACARLQDASLGLGQATLPHLLYNHRLLTRNMKAITAWLGVPRDEVLAPEGPVDAAFSVLVVRNSRGHPLSLLWNVAADNRFSTSDQISADLPYLVQAAVNARIGRHVPVLALAGCGGNVSYTYDLEWTADMVASAVMAVQLETSCDPLVRLGWARETMVLPIRDAVRSRDRADIELKLPQATEAFAYEADLLRQEGAEAVPAGVQVFGLGSYALVGLPGLPFVEFALAIKAQSPFRSTIVAGNAHDYLGYVITRRAFENGGFESWPTRTSRIGPGGGEFMAERAITLLRRLQGA